MTHIPPGPTEVPALPESVKDDTMKIADFKEPNGVTSGYRPPDRIVAHNPELSPHP